MSQTQMRFTVPAAIVAVAALAIAGCGSDDNEAGDARAAGNGADRAFVADMIPHHESAVAMAQIARRRGQAAFVKTLARDIIRAQNAEIATMREQDRELAADGIDKGSLGVPAHMKGMDDDPASLESASPFDRAFLAMMIPHHEGAITMAKAEQEKGTDSELKRLAQAIVIAQEREISEMRAHLGESSGAMEEESDQHDHSG